MHECRVPNITTTENKEKITDVVIGNHNYTVYVCDHMEDPDDKDTQWLGATRGFTAEICLADGQTSEALLETIIHELCHAYVWSYGYHIDNEEAMCDFFGSRGDNIIDRANTIFEKIRESKKYNFYVKD